MLGLGLGFRLIFVYLLYKSLLQMEQDNVESRSNIPFPVITNTVPLAPPEEGESELVPRTSVSGRATGRLSVSARYNIHETDTQ